jgi:tRNA-2-methylthio-N6-dimethylallyladenosine synthase
VAVRYTVTTFGCQMNVHDSERMHEVLRSAGLDEVDAVREADVVVLNTCSVREKAEQKLRSEVGRLAKLKRERPGLLVVVAGCVAQQEGERLLRDYRDIDLVIGPDNIPELARLIADLGAGAPPLARTVFDLEAPQFLTALSVAEGAATAFVTTMKGCNERCSFCIVPTTRGPERYRPSAEVVAEIAALVERGVAEVTLLGQTVNSYRDPSRALELAPSADPSDEDESEFAALLRAVAERVPGLRRLRYTSPHPRHLVPSLIRAHAELQVLPRHVHLPVQSGSDRMLKRMIRRYTREEYLRRITKLRESVPGLTLSTDIIVGFPGESEADFAETLSLIREAGFVGVYGFKYSVRPFTPAKKLGDDVSELEKSERLARLFELSEGLVARHLAGLVGSTQEVLIEGASKRGVSPEGPAGPNAGASYSGRTNRNEIVHVDDPACEGLVGQVVGVTVKRALKHSVVAELDELARRRGLEVLASRPAKPRGRRSLPVVAVGEA